MILSILLFLSVSLSHGSINTNQYSNFKKTAFSDQADMKQRWKALVELSKIPHKDRQKDLLKASKSQVWFMRNAALLAINEINKVEGRKVAIQLLDDPSLVVRSAAVDVLAKHIQSSPEVRQVLWKEFQDKQNIVKNRSLWIRPQILKHLAEAPITTEAEQFAGLASHSDNEIREIAGSALKKIK